MNLTASERKTIFLSSLGGALEFYDFIIYSIFATIISQVFFPQSDTLASLMGTYAVFAIGYLVRPLGGVIFSHFGDKYGRKTTFISSVMLMAVPTFIIGLLPTNAEAGITATLLLIALRLLQGISIGGEIPGALTFTCEHVAPNYRGFACGVIFAFFNIGIILGSVISLLLHHFLTSAQLLAWGWRIPFLFGGLLGLVSFYLRKKMTESPIFLALHAIKKSHSLPLMETVKNHSRALLQGVALTCLGTVVINLLFLYLPTYLTTLLHYSTQQATLINLLNLVIFSILLIGISRLSDRVGRRVILSVGALGFVFFAHFIFSRFNNHSILNLMMLMFIITFLSACITIYPCLLVELFPTSIRYTGIAVSYNLGFAFFGGLTPLIATYLIKVTNDILAPSFYLILTATICFFASLLLKNKHGQVLS